MLKSVVNIIDFEILYNILFEIKEFTNIEPINHKDLKSFLDSSKKNNFDKNASVIIKENLTNNHINKNKVIILNNLPLNIFNLIDKININLLKQKYNFQSNIIINDYNLNLNSRVISKEKNDLKLTEKEIEIILFLKDQKNPKKISNLQKEVWGYVEDLETHTVETHVYRLRKKIIDKFQDKNFIKSLKDGYSI